MPHHLRTTSVSILIKLRRSVGVFKRTQRTLLIVGALGLVGTFSLGWYVGSDSINFRINKSIETFGEVFRHVALDYVDEVEPEKFIRTGLDAMLATLDPYTVYMDQEQSEDFDSQVSGQYVGLGIQAGVRDSMLTINAVADGYSAHRAGIRVGDRLVAIDGHPTLRLSSRELRKYTRGQVGSVAKLDVLRDGRSDTLHFELNRVEVYVKSVSYVQMLPNGVGVIRLDRFTRKSVQEVRSAVDSLKSMGQLKGIVLDLRDNPGGLLDAAIGICETFVRNGSLIVSTKGRPGTESRVYTSSTIPYEGEAPLVLVVNSSSASASEVVAGCIQDLDRGLVCGEQSFGKGLVQSQISVPYSTTLKMTTQRYYCPSGRCVQRIDYGRKRSGVILDTSTTTHQFLTLNKRPVMDATGVSPDTLMKDKEYPEFVRELLEKNMLFNFANEYCASKNKLPSNFSAAQLIDDLEKYCLKQKFSFQSSAAQKIDEVQKLVSTEKYPSQIVHQLEEVEQLIGKENQRLFRTHSKLLTKLIDKEIRSRFMSDRQLLQYQMRQDDLIVRASDLALSEQYRTLLRTPVATK